ncbi:MAG: beta-ketoacyl-ACP synthase III [Deltaproteobacteria bacterium]
MLRSRVIGTGSYAPDKVVSNNDLKAVVETSDEWISTRTGIRQRRVCTNDTSATMAVKASLKAIKAAGIAPEDIGLIVVGTVTPPLVFPSIACLIQAELGIKGGVPAFDVSAACSGFLYALDIADKYIKSGPFKTALVVGVDQFSRLLDWSDRNTCVLFGDGAGAVVLRAEDTEKGILSCHIHSDGRYWELLYVPGSIRPCRFENTADAPEPYLKMNGNETFRLAVRTMGDAITEVMERNNLKKDDIGLLIPHQANIRIINAAKERLKLPDEKVYTNLDKYGNTSAGSIPLALDEALGSGRIKDNDIVLFVAFGGGLTWASAAMRW